MDTVDRKGLQLTETSLTNRSPSLLFESSGARALLVGSGTHRADALISSVPTAVPTVTRLGTCLTEHTGLTKDRLRLLIDPKDPSQLITAVNHMSSEASTVMLFCYVGHGLIGPDRRLYLATQATTDLSKGAPEYQALPFSAIQHALTQSNAELVVVMLDCCFAGRANPLGSPPRAELLDTPWPGAYLLRF
ncbi:hypothetical protein ACQP2T_26850 [Nonomuraea sp. CA-143628]|uniref:hypothetical protein n=1 Tax=Nonomuraea sp. CA-143628 TaxID=3239997 RepID=UPI003D8DC6B2